MILADTVVWADHLGRGDARLAELLTQGQFLMHPYVLGELALGNLPRRVKLLRDLSLLQYLAIPRHNEVMSLIEERRLFGSGVGYVHAHLIAGVLLTDRCELWSRDERLVDVPNAWELRSSLPATNTARRYAAPATHPNI